MKKVFLVYSLKKEYLKNVHEFLIEALKIADNIIYEKLKDIDCNYFTNYTEVPTYIVYEGIPDEFISDNKKYSFVGFDIIYSYFKLHEYKDETILFSQFKNKLAKLDNYAPLNKYVYNLGYC